MNDGSTLHPRTNRLRSQISHTLWPTASTLRRMFLPHLLHWVGLASGIRARVTVQDFPTAELHRRRRKRLDRHHHYPRQVLLSLIPMYHRNRLMGPSAPSAPAWLERRIGAAVDDLPQRHLVANSRTTERGSSSVHSALTPSSQNTIGPGTRSHCTSRWRNGYALQTGPLLQTTSRVTSNVCTAVFTAHLATTLRHTIIVNVRTRV